MHLRRFGQLVGTGRSKLGKNWQCDKSFQEQGNCPCAIEGDVTWNDFLRNSVVLKADAV